MKKHKKGIKLSRGRVARQALLRSLIRALVAHGTIETTEAKAKYLNNNIAKIIKLAKEDNVNARRRVYAILANDRKTTDNIFTLVDKNFSKRIGGYTRIVKLPNRKGDGSRSVRIEWVKQQSIPDEKGDKKDKKSKRKENGKNNVAKKKK